MKSEFKKIADDCELYIEPQSQSRMLEVEFFGEQVAKKCCEILDDKRFDNVRPSMIIDQAMIKQFFEIK
jgi:hypothetical protein